MPPVFLKAIVLTVRSCALFDVVFLLHRTVNIFGDNDNITFSMSGGVAFHDRAMGETFFSRPRCSVNEGKTAIVSGGTINFMTWQQQ